MSFIYPLGLLGLLAVPIIIIIYILRSKYKNKNVSSTFIWKRSLKYIKRRIPLNFIMSLLLILQILAVVAASFAIARPTVKPLKSEEKIVIIDASASMLAESGGQTRFEYAKQMLVEATDKVGSNNQITLIVANSDVKAPVISRETDKGKVLTALQGIECTMGNADINKALELAGDILDQNAGATIQLYTDKSYIDAEGVEIIDCKREGEWNAGIIALEDNELITGTEFIAQIGNYGLNSSCHIKLEVDGVVLAQKTIELKANEIKTVRFTHSTTQSTGADEERVSISREKAVKKYESAKVFINAEDNFGYDDELVIYPKEKINPKIMYISKYVKSEGGKVNANLSLLYRAFAAAGYSIDTSNMYTSVEEVEEFKGYDLYIFEGVQPYDIPTDGAVWILDANVLPEATGIVVDNTSLEDRNGFNIEKSLSLDIIQEIVKNVELSPLKLTVSGSVVQIPASVTKYRLMDLSGSTFRPVYTVKNGEESHNVLAGGSVGSVRMIVSSFDFGDSSLGVFISDFPLLVKNMVEYSIPDPLTDRTAPVGSTINFNFPAGATDIVYNYNGELMNKLSINELKYDIKIDQPGKYELVVTYPDGDDRDTLEEVKTYVVTGHIADEESMIVQRVPTESIVAPIPDDASQETFEPVEIFPYLIALLILLLIFEWGVYYREQH
ncbi:MAG: VWA domain-containing protein [Ruminococcaceae bacterium]|nr:VWA domain-containing protein [Oscillospiraceae bacterium]